MNNFISDEEFENFSLDTLSQEEIEAEESLKQYNLEHNINIKEVELYYKPSEITEGFEGKVIGRGNVYALRSSKQARKILIDNFG